MFTTLQIALAKLTLALLAASTASYSVPAPTTPKTVISGHGWAYTVPFEVENSSTIARIIQCESQGANISRPDSNGRESDGILQFNRSDSDVMGSGTWADMEKRFNFYGSPIVPADAIHLSDIMISNGLVTRWTCAKYLHIK